MVEEGRGKEEKEMEGRGRGREVCRLNGMKGLKESWDTMAET